MYIEQSSYRFVAYCRPATIAGDISLSILDETIASFSQGDGRVHEMMQLAKDKHGEILKWIELQELGEDGEWSAVGRFYPESFA